MNNPEIKKEPTSRRVTYAGLVAQKRERVETIAEEINLFTGLDVKARPHNIIECDTIAGSLIYHTCETQNIMGNVYRFISHYGAKLQSWGLEKAITETALKI